MCSNLILIKGAGDLATGTAHRLARCGFPVVMLEVPEPTVIRRTVAFAEAVFSRICVVEGITANLADSPGEVQGIVDSGKIAVLVDPLGSAVNLFKPIAV
ncbi:MAG: molybdenum hydroxylase, partial [Clostridia bacterium]|nr:molybdenum hydroxylase [Clostridia bacterium]